MYHQIEDIRVTNLVLFHTVGDNWEHLEGLSTTPDNSSFQWVLQRIHGLTFRSLPGGGKLLEDRVFSQHWVKQNPFHSLPPRCGYLMGIPSPYAWDKAYPEITWFLTRVFSRATGHLRGLNSCDLWALGEDDAVGAWGRFPSLPHRLKYHHPSVNVRQQPPTWTLSFHQAPYGLQTVQPPEGCFNNIRQVSSLLCSKPFCSSPHLSK